MKYLSLLVWLCFPPMFSFSQNQNEAVQKGWLVFFGAEEVCFPDNLNKSRLNFFDKKERLNGFNVNFVGYNSCVYKVISKSHPVKMYYGNDSIYLLPVIFTVKLKDEKIRSVKSSADSVEIYEIKFNGEKYRLGYTLKDDVEVTSVRPYLKNDLRRAKRTECPFYEGP